MRYLFKDQADKFNTPLAGSRSASATAVGTTLVPLRLERTLSNDVSRLRSAFVRNLSPTISIKHSLLRNFGIFLLEVPRRLGCNEALDAATRCLIAVYEPYCAGQHEVASATLVEFARALNALRRGLTDPTIAHTSETLCSVMILMLAQVWQAVHSNISRPDIEAVTIRYQSQSQCKPFCRGCSDSEEQGSIRSTVRFRRKAFPVNEGSSGENLFELFWMFLIFYRSFQPLQPWTWTLHLDNGKNLSSLILMMERRREKS